MRIELPVATWADATHHAEDDAHTLTVAALSAAPWPAEAWSNVPALTLRTQVTGPQPATLTLTL